MINSEESLRKIKKTLSSYKKKNIIEKYQKKEFMVGTFLEKKYKISRKFITNKYTNKKLYYSILRSKKEKKRIAQIIMVHGLLDSSMLIEIASLFAENNITVHLFDLSGEGFSDGVINNEEISDNLKDIVTILKKADENLPTFIYGHSIGGLLVLILLALNNELLLNGVLLSSSILSIPEERNFNYLKELFFTRYPGNLVSPFLVNSYINPTRFTKINKITKYICLKQQEISFFGFFKKNEKNCINNFSY